jgi:hypothetical protein
MHRAESSLHPAPVSNKAGDPHLELLRSSFLEDRSAFAGSRRAVRASVDDDQ